MAAERAAAAGGGRTRHAGRSGEGAAALLRTPAAATERCSKADECAQYVGVFYDESKSANKRFRAYIWFASKTYHICNCATAEAAARAYDAIARMVPNCKLNFPTTSSVAASGVVPGNGARSSRSLPSKSKLLAAIAAVRQAPARIDEIKDGAKYIGVRSDKRRALLFTSEIRFDGTRKYLGVHPTAEAAARAYDVVARTIPGRKLNFPVAASASTPRSDIQAAACTHVCWTKPSDPPLEPIKEHKEPVRSLKRMRRE
jgi:hypothetical protein